LTAFREGGKFYWLVRRVIEDLQTYLDQPATAGLCAGVEPMISFYRQQFEPLSERIAFVEAMLSRADRRLQASLNRLIALQARRIGDDTVAQPAAIRPAPQPATVSPAAPGQQRLFEFLEAHGAKLPARASGISDSRLLERLAAARTFVNTAAEPTFDTEARTRSIEGLRALETMHYADRTARIYRDFLEAVSAAFDRIEASHRTHCKCGGQQ
jgi:hypothetical protein